MGMYLFFSLTGYFSQISAVHFLGGVSHKCDCRSSRELRGVMAMWLSAYLVSAGDFSNSILGRLQNLTKPDI